MTGCGTPAGAGRKYSATAATVAAAAISLETGNWLTSGGTSGSGDRQ
jgi:hypothetical protein